MKDELDNESRKGISVEEIDEYYPKACEFIKACEDLI